MCNLAVLCCQMIGYKLWRWANWRFFLDKNEDLPPLGTRKSSSTQKYVLFRMGYMMYVSFWGGYFVCILLGWKWIMDDFFLQVGFWKNWKHQLERWTCNCPNRCPMEMTQFAKYFVFVQTKVEEHLCVALMSPHGSSRIYPGVFS